MYRTHIGNGQGAGAHGRHGPARFAMAFGTAGIVLFALAGVAQAAPDGGPNAVMGLGSARVGAGIPPVLTYMTTGVPAGSVLYLQRAPGDGQAWQDVGRMAAGSGTVRAPADPAGRWRYRIAVTRGGVTVATSAASTLTVTRAATGNACTTCAIKAALPWLAPVIAPVIEYVIQQVGPAALAYLGSLLGL